LQSGRCAQEMFDPLAGDELADIEQNRFGVEIELWPAWSLKISLVGSGGSVCNSRIRFRDPLSLASNSWMTVRN
jgi:hypothetical protein